MLHLKISCAPYPLFCLITLSVVALITTEAVTDETYAVHYCPNTTTYSPNSIYQTTLNQLLSWLTSNSSTAKNGYYNTTIGANTPNNTIYGSFLCRGDLTTTACHDCVSAAAKKVLQPDFCPVGKESVIWFAECMVRYSDQPFFSVAAEVPVYSLSNTGNVPDESHFMTVLGDTMNSAAEQAAKGGADKKFGTKEANISSFQTLYTLAQCTPDLSEFGCQKCLKIGTGQLPSCCDGKLGGRVLIPSCNVRFELYPFYHEMDVPLPPPQSNPNPKVQISSVEFLQFDVDTIIEATNNFSGGNKLGEGGFGEVYKGTLPNGQDIAVKRLSRNSRQGIIEFKNEVLLVAKLQHRNLVRLLGFCLDGEEKMLIYEFVANKSLDRFLFDASKQHQLSWPRRYKIIEGIARGILYLHEDSRLRIIHRDLKAGNILLDEDSNPKISDFGMARLFGADQTQANTNRVVGTIGYMPPEYAMRGQFSDKTDVYSFGVLVLEIISGKKITSFYDSGYAGDLLNYAWKHWRDGTPLELLDMSLRESYSRAEVIKCIHVGLCCVQEDPAQRPTMQAIVLILNSHTVTLASPAQPPAGYIGSRSHSNFPTKEMVNSSSDKSTNTSTSQSSINRPTLPSKEMENSNVSTSITEVYPR
ncbi:putative receptor-like protein kinase At4g00960 isoform X2 [Arachis ipaensis]|uniref:putative receptor-like protein kinase At4g00960 isoform X2 n=1 Tax=Arachis ipaensis TaxID=130454 RepID=UPI000A2B6BA8|nr:putative receptor-like protein kinase At4g00960 isoform X2 [Arachis ipaensis]XP_025676242.1 putative receptor-like protein kinase At4g00960 isoform X2 [Arachis hypogaea]